MRTAGLLARKDLRTLARSRPLLVALVGYPVLIAVLLLLLIYDSNQSTTIALVNEDSSGSSVSIGSSHYGVAQYVREAERNGATVKTMTRSAAMHALDEGQVGGVVVIPNGFIGTLKSGLFNASIDLYTGDNALGEQVADRIQSSVFALDLDVSNAFVRQNATILNKLVTGGTVNLTGTDIDALGLKPAVTQLQGIHLDPSRPQDAAAIQAVTGFANEAEKGLTFADAALQVTNAPVRLRDHKESGKSPKLTSKAMSYALSIAIAFICTVLIAASLAAERDEHVLGRLLHGIVSRGALLASKLLVGALLAASVSAGLFAAFAILAPQAWTRLPLLLLGVIVAGLAFSGLGMLLATLMRDARTATLSAILLVLPLIPLALLPGTTGVLHAISETLPLQPSQQLFNSLLYDHSPWGALGRGLAQLVGIALVCTALSHRLLRRLI